MRPEGRGELDSLYFNYPTFKATRVAEQDGADIRHPVVIVGAGPVGMTAALSLARHGVRSVLIEKKATFNDGSRAICLARASFQILEQIGAVAPVSQQGAGLDKGAQLFSRHGSPRIRDATSGA
jgi:3-(3-hydroxy-phenyl)propionate hydroxylase